MVALNMERKWMTTSACYTTLKRTMVTLNMLPFTAVLSRTAEATVSILHYSGSEATLAKGTFAIGCLSGTVLHLTGLFVCDAYGTDARTLPIFSIIGKVLMPISSMMGDSSSRLLLSLTKKDCL